ncbi:transposase [Streptomyces mauvecolor]
MNERDCIHLLDGVHQLVKAPVVRVRDRLNTHIFSKVWQLATGHEWLMAFLPPAPRHS